VFSNALDSLQKAAGSVQPDLPEEPSEAQLIEAERALTGDNIVETFSETFRVNELQQRRHALQHTARLEDPRTAGEVNRMELITINQAIAYHEYFPEIVHDTIDVLRRYEALRASTPQVSLALQQGEQQARFYLTELNRALRERTAFANILLIDDRLGKHIGNTEHLMRMRSEHLSSVDLSETSTQVLLRGAMDAKWRQGNLLNQRLIELLAGAAKVPGVDAGFLPQRLYLDLLAERYQQILKEEKEVVKDGRLIEARKRHDALARKNKQARAGKGDALSESEGAEYERLRALMADRNGYLGELGEQRKKILGEIFSFTDILASDQMRRSELATIQHQFGDRFDFENVSPPNPNQTPEEIRRRMGEDMERRSQFHLERFEAFLGRIEEDVLDAGIGEWTENVSNKRGREAIRSANHALTNLLTKILPESFGLREHMREQLTQPLDEALGWPPGKETWEELTPDEQQKVLEKSQSVLDAIRSFDREKIVQFRTTVDLLQMMPVASTYLNEEVTQPLPTERVTAENREALIERYGGATVYIMLFRQMDADWEKFLGEYGTFLTRVNTTIDTHLDVSGELFRLGNIYNDLKWYFIAAAVVAFGTGILVALMGVKLVRATGRLALRTVHFGSRMTREGAQMAGAVFQKTKASLERLARLGTAEELTRMRSLQRERALAEWLENTRVGKGFARMRAFSQLKPIRIGGKALKYSAWAAIPALAWYEMHLNAERVSVAEGNTALQGEYSSQDTTTLLEAGGVGATLLIPGVVPAAVLAAPVIYAADYSKNRSEVRAAWKHDVGDWMRENDSAGLRQKIKDTTLERAVEAGGGGALRPRITLPSKEDQLDAADDIENANRSARENIYEAYFWQNLLVPAGTSKEDAQRAIREKMYYARLVTKGEYNDTFNWAFSHADVYAELMERLRSMENTGEDPLILYPGENGEAKELDLRKLRTGVGNPRDIQEIVTRYVTFVQPSEEVLLFNAIGEFQKENPKGAVEIALRRKLTHEVYAAEARIREVNWPGLGITGGEKKSEAIVRSYVAYKIDEKIPLIVQCLLEGEFASEDYVQQLNDLRHLCQEIINAQDTDALRKKAAQYFEEKSFLDWAKNAPEDVLLRVLQPKEK